MRWSLSLLFVSGLQAQAQERLPVIDKHLHALAADNQAGKRDILYHNAARFLRLSTDEIARQHKK